MKKKKKAASEVSPPVEQDSNNIESNIKQEVEGNPDKEPMIEGLPDYEPGTKHEGWLHVRTNSQILFVPKRRRSNGNGMDTTYTGDDLTIQESSKKVRVTMVFDKQRLTSKKAYDQVSKLIRKFIDMGLI